MPRHRAPSPTAMWVARRAMGAITAPPPRHTGIHRAPASLPAGTLLLGGYRPQAMLAAVVAAAVMVVNLGPQDAQDVTAVQTADRGPVPSQPTGKPRPPKNSAARQPAPPRQSRPGSTSPADPAQPGQAAEPEPSEPPGERAEAAGARRTGPAGSLRRTGTATVALTFDDGPDPEQTPKLLDLLAEHKVKATFCVVGTRARAFPALVRRIADEGHALCNHSWEHDFKLGDADDNAIRRDLENTSLAIRAAAPHARIGYFRAPGGFFTDRLVTLAAEMGMRSIYWEVDPRDWDRPDDEEDEAHVDRIVNVVQEETRPGSIVLSHDFNQPLTVAAYRRLLPVLTERFQLAALPEPADAKPADPGPAQP